MHFDNYDGRTLRKFENILSVYSHVMFREIGKAEKVYALETQEHLRQPPEISEMKEITSGKKWGGEYASMWLRCGFTVPKGMKGKTLCVMLETDAVETLAFDGGKPCGLTNSKYDFLGGMHSVIFLDGDAVPGKKHDLAFECYAGHTRIGTEPYDRYFEEDTFQGNVFHTFQGISFVAVDKPVFDCLFDIYVVLQMAKLGKDNFASLKAYDCLMKAFPYLVQDVLAVTPEELDEACLKVSEILAPALEKNGGDESRGYIGLIGHSHMDTAWLWPVSETVRKCARTYSQVLKYMDIYPEYTFIQSSALHLDWMRTYYPSVFEGIKKRVKEGRYEPNGGVWVECDCNLTSGESMIRQFLFGQRFTKKYLDYTSDSFWLPDTFGYNGAIPQIMLGCGVKYFYTTKISWNDLNVFPSDTFIWKGIDGSEVLTNFTAIHMLPDPTNVDRHVKAITDKKATDAKLMSYGYGDGGGGPTFAQLEFLKRTLGLPGLPVTESTTASAFMHRIEKNVDRLPVYDGELYLEFHRGTLTQMHEVKKNNRLAENAMREFELVNVISGLPTDEKHDELYKILLINQFHDILPGTCISKVYERTIPEMRKLIADTKALTGRYLEGMTVPKRGRISLFNTLSFDRHDVTVLDGEHTFRNAQSQTYTDQEGKVKTAVRVDVKAYSTAELSKGPGKGSVSPFTMKGGILETPFYKVKFDGDGYISELYDRISGRRVDTGKAPLGTLWFGEDVPTSYDAWEIEYDVFLKMKPLKASGKTVTVSDGAVEFRLRNEYDVGKKSHAVVDTVFYPDTRRIDYEMRIDWHERHKLLKAGFDVDIRSAFMKNEIQFGHVERPTTRNNSWDSAKFEVCNHKWTDLSEAHYGVAVLNDCKYGISCCGTDMRLTLMKGGMRPDNKTEEGVHTMRYALLPHEGRMNAENVIYPAYEFNNPVIPCKGELKLDVPFGIKGTGIICENVKNAEDVKNAYVLRLYESECGHSSCELDLRKFKKAWITDMLENKQTELKPDANGIIKLDFRPFEIKTVLVER